MNIEIVNEPIQSLESAGELSIREQKFLKLAKAFTAGCGECGGKNNQRMPGVFHRWGDETVSDQRMKATCI